MSPVGSRSPGLRSSQNDSEGTSQIGRNRVRLPALNLTVQLVSAILRMHFFHFDYSYRMYPIYH